MPQLARLAGVVFAALRWVAVIAVSAAVLSFVVQAALPMAVDPLNVEVCTSRLKAVHVAVGNFAQDYGRSPGSLDELRPYASDPQVLACPQGGRYVVDWQAARTGAPMVRCLNHWGLYRQWGRLKRGRRTEIVLMPGGRVDVREAPEPGPK